VALPNSCRLCAADSQSLFVTTPHVFGDERRERGFVRCSACGVHFLYPPLAQEEEAAFYRGEFERFMETRAGKASGWRDPMDHVEASGHQVDRRFRYLAPLIPPSGSVLEVGCSSGFMLYPLLTKGFSCSGIEPSGLFSDFCRSHGIATFESIDELRRIDPKCRFDIIMHFFVLEHLSDPQRSIKEHLSLLKPGGKLVIEVPNSADPLRTIYDLPSFERFYWSVAHHWYWNEQSLTWLLNQTGCEFDIVREQRYDLSNHLYWAQHGKPGGQGYYGDYFGPNLDDAYRKRLIEIGLCDTLVAIVSR